MEPQNSKKWIWIVLVIVIVAGAAWFVFGKGWSAKKTVENNTVAPAPEDSTTAIEKDLGLIDVGDVEKEMQDVEEDINSL